MTPPRSPLWIVAACFAVWLPLAGLSLALLGHTIGRYGMTYATERAVHCYKIYDVDYGRAKVEDCIAERLTPAENGAVTGRARESYLSQASLILCFLLAPAMILALLLLGLQRLRVFFLSLNERSSQCP